MLAAIPMLLAEQGCSDCKSAFKSWDRDNGTWQHLAVHKWEKDRKAATFPTRMQFVTLPRAFLLLALGMSWFWKNQVLWEELVRKLPSSSATGKLSCSSAPGSGHRANSLGFLCPWNIIFICFYYVEIVLHQLALISPPSFGWSLKPDLRSRAGAPVSLCSGLCSQVTECSLTST